MTKFYPELIWTIVSAPHIFQTYQNHKAIEINWKHKIKQQHQLKIEYLQRFHLHCVKVNPNINYSISISSLDTSKFKPTIKSNTPFWNILKKRPDKCTNFFHTIPLGKKAWYFLPFPVNDTDLEKRADP